VSGDGSARHFTPAPCPRCTGLGDAHYLTCPTLRLPWWGQDDKARRVRLVPVDEAEDDAAWGLLAGTGGE